MKEEDGTFRYIIPYGGYRWWWDSPATLLQVSRERSGKEIEKEVDNV